MARPEGEKGIVLGEQVQRGEFVKGDARIELGIGRAGGDRHVVAERGEGAGQFAQIDALSADMRVRAIARDQYTQRADRRHLTRLFHLCGNKGMSFHDA